MAAAATTLRPRPQKPRASTKKLTPRQEVSKDLLAAMLAGPYAENILTDEVNGRERAVRLALAFTDSFLEMSA